jgi:hypothetical protein
MRQAQIIPQMSFLGIDVRKECGYK